MLLHSLAHQDRHCTVNQKNKAPKYSFYNWSQIADISQSITLHSRNGQRMTPTHKYILRRIDGYQIKLDNTTKNIGELRQFVAQEPVLRAMQAIRVGQTLRPVQHQPANRDGEGFSSAVLVGEQRLAAGVH